MVQNFETLNVETILKNIEKTKENHVTSFSNIRSCGKKTDINKYGKKQSEIEKLQKSFSGKCDLKCGKDQNLKKFKLNKK